MFKKLPKLFLLSDVAEFLIFFFDLAFSVSESESESDDDESDDDEHNLTVIFRHWNNAPFKDFILYLQKISHSSI